MIEKSAIASYPISPARAEGKPPVGIGPSGRVPSAGTDTILINFYRIRITHKTACASQFGIVFSGKPHPSRMNDNSVTDRSNQRSSHAHFGADAR